MCVTCGPFHFTLSSTDTATVAFWLCITALAPASFPAATEAGVTHGDPLAMILYGLAILDMIRDSKSQFKSLLHVWFADDDNAGRKLQELKQLFACLKKGKNIWLLLGPPEMCPHHHPGQLGGNLGHFSWSA